MSNPEGPSSPDDEKREQQRHRDELDQILNKIRRGLVLNADDSQALQSELTPEEFVEEKILPAVLASGNKEIAKFFLDTFGDDFPDDRERLEEIAGLKHDNNKDGEEDAP